VVEPTADLLVSAGGYLATVAAAADDPAGERMTAASWWSGCS
jgi:hypothetical protein